MFPSFQKASSTKLEGGKYAGDRRPSSWKSAQRNQSLLVCGADKFWRILFFHPTEGFLQKSEFWYWKSLLMIVFFFDKTFSSFQKVSLAKLEGGTYAGGGRPPYNIFINEIQWTIEHLLTICSSKMEVAVFVRTLWISPTECTPCPPFCIEWGMFPLAVAGTGLRRKRTLPVSDARMSHTSSTLMARFNSISLIFKISSPSFITPDNEKIYQKGILNIVLNIHGGSQ